MKMPFAPRVARFGAEVVKVLHVAFFWYGYCKVHFVCSISLLRMPSLCRGRQHEPACPSERFPRVWGEPFWWTPLHESSLGVGVPRSIFLCPRACSRRLCDHYFFSPRSHVLVLRGTSVFPMGPTKKSKATKKKT